MRRVRLAGLVALSLLFVLSAGCSRSYWRRNADSEAYGLIREKTKLDARWAPPRSDVIPSPLSRLYDPADPDFGALPPDDPAARRYMDWMSDCERIRGSDYWDEIGASHSIENPAWVASLPADGLPGPLLAGQRKTDLVAPETKPLPLLDRFAITESVRSFDLPSIFRRQGDTPAGRATLATADVKAIGQAVPDENPHWRRRNALPPDAKTALQETALREGEAPAEPHGLLASKSGQGGPTLRVGRSVSERRTTLSGSAGASPSPAATASKKHNDIQLTAFQEEPDAPAPLPGDDDPDPIPQIPGATPRAFDLPDAEQELSPVPGDPETAPQPSVGSNIVVANPALPAVEDLTLADALRLSYLHGRDYQFQIEEVFLAALDLAFDRFQFDVRFLGIGGRPSSDLAYVGTPDGTQSLTANNRIGISRLLPAGGQWAVELANQTLWLFSDAPDESGTASTLTFSFVQPLLFAAGRKVILEDLTQSERNLLYAARDLARFRQSFFVDTVTGYLGLLQTIQQIANQEDNIRRLTDQLEISRANILTTDALSRTQLEIQLLNQLNQLRNSRRALQDRLDQYKIALGLPPDLQLSLDTKLLVPFQLISSELVVLEQELDDQFLPVFATIDPDQPQPERLREAIAALGPLVDRVRDVAIPQVENDFRRVAENRPRRLAALPEPQAANLERVNENAARDREFFGFALQQFGNNVEQLERLSAEAETAETLPQRRDDEARDDERRDDERRDIFDLYRDIDASQENLLRIVRNLQGVQVGLRTELIRLNPFEMSQTEAVGYALTNRVDLMNQKALVTDARRKIEVAENALRSVLDLRVEQDVSTQPIFNNDNPLDFRRTNSTFRAGVRFVAPLDQIAQRNVYRISQINYQRVRRSYMQFEDQVKFQVRTSWRELEVLEQNFEVARYALRIAAQQYDLAVENTADPRQQTTGRGGAGQAGTQLLQALNSVLRSQNDLIGIWVNYESTRLNIYRDMGIMEIDARGLWVDPFYQNGLTLPDGPVQGPPGWVNPTDGTDGPPEGSDGPAVIPPAPPPPAGVQNDGGGPSGPTPASNPVALRPVAPAGRGVRQAAYSRPTSTPPREAGHDRTRQPPVPGRRDRPADQKRAEAGPQDVAKPRWRPSAQAPPR